MILIAAFVAALHVGNNSRPINAEHSACHAFAKHVALSAAQTFVGCYEGRSAFSDSVYRVF